MQLFSKSGQSVEDLNHKSFTGNDFSVKYNDGLYIYLYKLLAWLIIHRIHTTPYAAQQSLFLHDLTMLNLTSIHTSTITNKDLDYKVIVGTI